MGASVQPETQQNQEGSHSQNQENSGEQNQQSNQTEAQASGSQTTSTSDNKAERLLQLYEANMREAHQRASQLQNELDRRTRAEQEAQANQPPQVPEISASEFWNKPLPHIAQIIREETRKAVQPLYEFKQQVENQNKYESVKSRFKNDPRYREIFPKIEGIVDQMMGASGAEPTDALMNATILSAIGALHTGQLPGITLDTGTQQQQNQHGNTQQMGQQTNSQAQDTRVITPPHLRPSPVVQQTTGDNKPKLRDLTELEDRLRRENNMTKEEFLSWLDVPPHEVAHAKIGKPVQQENPQSQVQRSATPNTGQGR